MNTSGGFSGPWIFVTPAEPDLVGLARTFSMYLHTPLVIYLRGDLGAGKTTFARALIQSLGYAGRVKSPTYGLLETYFAGAVHTLHLDLYRINHPAEVEHLAIRDQFDENSLLLVEWPEKGAEFLPPADLELYFGEADGRRFARISPLSPTGMNLSQEVQGKL
jgi:tRNA threonylcarbamoyladenosine biosynthesis protein TsaE